MPCFRCAFVLLSLGLIGGSGCLSGAYDKDFVASLERHRQEAAFQKLVPAAQERAGGRLGIRPPQALNEQDDAGSQPWAMPPFLGDFPGFAAAYGVQVPDGDAKVHAVLTVWVPTDKESGLEDIKKTLQQKLQAVPAFAKAKPTWVIAEEVGGGPQWSVLSFQGKQPFVQIKEDKPATADLDGETQLWLAADGAMKTAALLVWRVPQAAAVRVPLAELAPLVARKVEFRAVAEPAAAGNATPAK